MSMSDELAQLGALHQRGVLTDDEFARAKTRVLSGAGSTSGSSTGATAINSLRRSRSDRWVGGVCGGIAKATDMAPWIWRLLLVSLVLCGGTGVLLYLLMWILVPLEAPPFRPEQGGLQAG